MSTLTKPAAIAIAVTIGIAPSGPWARPALAGSAQSNTATDRQATPLLRSGDLVRLRSGGPLMTVGSVRGDQVICSWSDGDGVPRSASFPVTMLTAPATLPPENPNLQKDEQAADQYYRTHCPSGVLSLSGKFECDF